MYRFWPLFLAVFVLGCEPTPPPSAGASPALGGARIQGSSHLRQMLARLEASSSLLDGEGIGIASLVEELGEIVDLALRDEDFESQDRDGSVVLLRGETSCAPDADRCKELIDGLEVRLRLRALTSPAGLFVEVQTGPRSPFFLRIFEEELAIEVNLPEAEPLWELLFEERLHKLEDLGAYELLQGRLLLTVTSREAEGVELQLSILEDVEIASADPEGPGISVEPAIPALSLALDPASGNVELELGLGAVNLWGPAASFLFEEDPLAGRISIHLDGLQGRTSWIAGMSDSLLLVEGFGLGDETSRITLNGAPLLSLDLNPMDGRRVDLQLSRDPELGTVLQVVPALELRLGLTLANLADQCEVATWALDETFTLRLDGASAPAILFRGGEEELRILPTDLAELDAWQLPPIEVLAGQLVLESRSTRSVLVPTGMCLRTTEASAGRAPAPTEAADPEGVHLLDRIEAGICR